MEIETNSVDGIAVATIIGDIDGSNAAAAQSQILTLAQTCTKLVLDMSRVSYMSSAGLRMLLASYRAIAGKGGTVLLAGLSEDLSDTMSLTGFLSFFKTSATVLEGVGLLK
ncbi:MAG: anti-sigma factor antagonist [Chloroflexi bacterium]|nr:anti-sigma factor antagonist [Chloroflexota bacterium]